MNKIHRGEKSLNENLFFSCSIMSKGEFSHLRDLCLNLCIFQQAHSRVLGWMYRPEKRGEGTCFLAQ